MDFHPIEEREDQSDSEESHNEEAKELDKTLLTEGVKTERIIAGKRDLSDLCFICCFKLSDYLHRFIHLILEVTEETGKESLLSTRSGTSPKPQSQEPLPISLIERKEDCILVETEKSEFEESKVENIPSSKVPNREGNQNKCGRYKKFKYH